MIDKLILYLQLPYVRYAVIVGILISLCASFLGVTLVLKRFSYIGDGLSHVAFGALAIASVLKVSNNMYIILPLTILMAIFLLRKGKNKMVKGDAMIAVFSVSSLAFGYLLLNIFPSSSNITGDVCTTLFGSVSILTLKQSDVMLCIVLSIVTVLFFVVFYNKIFAVTFDEDFARASGTRADLINLILAVITAVVIVMAMNLVGSLLITALLVFPALSAMRLFKSFRKVMICAAVISVICAVIGLVIAILYGTPVGSTIVMADTVMFLICILVGRIKR